MREVFQNVPMAHSVACFNMTFSTEEFMNRIISITEHPEWEICCSRADQPLGFAGITITGDVRCAFAHDMMSKVNKKGKRYSWLRLLFPFIRQCNLQKWNASKIYCEAWVSNVHIEKIWVKAEMLEWLDDNLIEQLQTLGYPVEIVSWF